MPYTNHFRYIVHAGGRVLGGVQLDHETAPAFVVVGHRFEARFVDPGNENNGRQLEIERIEGNELYVKEATEDGSE